MKTSKPASVFLLVFFCWMLIAFNGFCSGQKAEGKTAAPKRATVWLKRTFNPDANQSIHDRAARWGEENGVDLDIEIIPTKSMIQKFNTAIEAKMFPDVNFLTAAMTASFAEKDLLSPMDTVLSEVEEQNGQIEQSMVNSVTMNGTTYAVPLWNSSQVLYYRKDLFADAGIGQPPDTWEEMKSLAAKISRPEDDVYGAGFSLGPGGDCYNQGSSLIFSYGGSILESDGKTSNFNTPQTVEALRVWLDMYHNGSMPPSVVNWDDSGNNKAYLSGQCAMVINSGSITNALRKPANKDMHDKTGCYYHAGGPKGRVLKHTGHFLGIFKGAKAPQVGEEIIKYLLDYQWYKQWMVSIAPVSNPVFSQSYSDPAWTEDPLNKLFLEQAKMQQQFGYPGSPTAAHGEFQNLRIISKTLQRTAVQNAPLEKAVAETEQFMKEHLEQLYGE